MSDKPREFWIRWIPMFGGYYTVHKKPIKHAPLCTEYRVIEYSAYQAVVAERDQLLNASQASYKTAEVYAQKCDTLKAERDALSHLHDFYYTCGECGGGTVGHTVVEATEPLVKQIVELEKERDAWRAEAERLAEVLQSIRNNLGRPPSPPFPAPIVYASEDAAKALTEHETFKRKMGAE